MYKRYKTKDESTKEKCTKDIKFKIYVQKKMCRRKHYKRQGLQMKKYKNLYKN